MATALILYPPPQDRKKFEHHYRTKHFPLVKKIPGLQSVQISRQPPRSLEGAEPYYLAIELEFASLVEMEAAFQSPESQAASADLANFAPPGRIRYTYNRVPIRGLTEVYRGMAMDISRNGSAPSVKGSADYFTGTVRVDNPFKGTGPSRIGGAVVTFEPGARTAWHTHPLGQTLIVTSGLGWAQCEGGPIEEIRPGDIVWFPPGERHWHGATGTTAVTHTAIAEVLDGISVEWMEHVTDAQYSTRDL